MSTIVILGATSAIAEQFARQYATPGNHLVLVSRNILALEEIEQDLRARGSQHIDCIAFDFSETVSIDELLEKVDSKVNKIDILLLAYGTLPAQDRCDSDVSYSENEFIVNGLSPILVLNSFAKRFKAEGSGTIAAISSVAGDRGRQSNFLYGSAKAALSTYLSGLRNALSGCDVHVLTIKPGFVDTPMTKDFKKGMLWVKPEKVANDIKNAIDNKKDVLYTPWFWKWIMLIIKLIPEFVFKRMKL